MRDLSKDNVTLKYPRFDFSYARRVADGISEEVGMGGSMTVYSASFSVRNEEQDYDLQDIIYSASIDTDNSAYPFYNKIDNNQRIVVGINKFINDDKEVDIPILEIDTRAEQSQMHKLNQLKKNRDQQQVENSLQEIRKTCQSGDNLLPIIIKAAKAYCTLGEIVDAMKLEFGEWQERSVF